MQNLFFVFDVAGEVSAYAHGKQIQADDGRKLQNRIAEQIAGKRRHDQFIGQATTGNDKYRNNQRWIHTHSPKTQVGAC